MSNRKSLSQPGSGGCGTMILIVSESSVIEADKGVNIINYKSAFETKVA